jgi:hypothetical protein
MVAFIVVYGDAAADRGIEIVSVICEMYQPRASTNWDAVESSAGTGNETAWPGCLTAGALSCGDVGDVE